MFCFPYPRDADTEPIRVLVIPSVKYSITERRGFFEFLKAVIEKDAKQFKASTPDTEFALNHSLASAYQTWLFFGIASEALGRDIGYEELADHDLDGSRPCIDLRMPDWYWRELKARWTRLEDSLTAAEFATARARLLRTYQDAVTQTIIVDCIACIWEDDELAKVILSVHMLLYLVVHVINADRPTITQSNAHSASTRLLKRRMVRNGWCKKRLNFLDASHLPYPALYFLSSLKPPRVNAEDHSSCSSEKCLVTSNLTKPLHRTDECLCDDIPVPIERVNAIVSSGGIPLVRIARSPLGEPELEVVPYTPSTRFVAISHVWADRQFGSAQNCLPQCQVRYLQEVFSLVPTAMKDWGLREWIVNWWGPRKPGNIAPPSRPYEYFWLDSFCIPQAAEHGHLRSKAIESMNLIYAAASHTFVFDKGLQRLDAGRRPASLAHGGRPTYYSPRDEDLLDVVANLYASNWMGRAWTLQEGILSGFIVFPLHGSLAYLKLLSPHYDVGYWEELATLIRKFTWLSARRRRPKPETSKCLQDQPEPFRESVRHQLFTHLKKSLHVEEYRQYARTPAERAARFVKAHSLLQSRTTTQAEDIPLILMNMSCMNANAISQSKSIDERMKQLFYGLESLPTELLFSDCPRVGRCAVDAWIPLEIAPEAFGGNHTLKLGSAGFTFETKADTKALQFYLLSSARSSDRFRLLLPSQDAKTVKYNVETLQRPTATVKHLGAPEGLWCIALDNSSPERGARFRVIRIVGSKYFLYFDSSLRLTEMDAAESLEDDQQDAKNECGAVRMNGDFILERSQASLESNISRPQNPEQYSDRLTVIGDIICHLTAWIERYLLRVVWGDENSMSTLFHIFYGLYIYQKLAWVHRALAAFVHRAWMATYQPDFDPNGPWKWFWKLSNWEPPIPFRTMTKWMVTMMFVLAFATNSWSLVVTTTLYWLPLFPRQELINMYIAAIASRIIIPWLF